MSGIPQDPQTHPQAAAPPPAIPPPYSPPQYPQVQYSTQAAQPQYQQMGVIGKQPLQSVVIGGAHPPKPESNMALACVTFWLCQICCGAVAIYFAWKSDEAYNRNDLQEAKSSGESAHQWSIIGIIVGSIIHVLLIIYSIYYYSEHGVLIYG